jgi:hypothetical protein
MGSAYEDWFLAEELLRRQCKRFELSMREIALFSISMEKRTR